VGHNLSLLRRLTASSHHLDAADLQSEVQRLACTPVDALAIGSTAQVAGRLRAVVYTPSAHLPTLEAELFDGSGSIALVWLGRRRIAGIEPGRRIVVRGRVGVRNGEAAIYNPWYELQCGQG
jgi:RecJ-like exonuclease